MDHIPAFKGQRGGDHYASQLQTKPEIALDQIRAAA